VADDARRQAPGTWIWFDLRSDAFASDRRGVRFAHGASRVFALSHGSHSGQRKLQPAFLSEHFVGWFNGNCDQAAAEPRYDQRSPLPDRHPSALMREMAQVVAVRAGRLRAGRSGRGVCPAAQIEGRGLGIDRSVAIGDIGLGWRCEPRGWRIVANLDFRSRSGCRLHREARQDLVRRQGQARQAARHLAETFRQDRHRDPPPRSTTDPRGGRAFVRADDGALPPLPLSRPRPQRRPSPALRRGRQARDGHGAGSSRCSRGRAAPDDREKGRKVMRRRRCLPSTQKMPVADAQDGRSASRKALRLDGTAMMMWT
jgi:hypothetical protein